jgi:ribosomal protein S12 methylthiotransferase accessory factor
VYEAVERYSGMAHGDEPTISARFIDLAPESVVHPSASMLYSDRQYAERHATNALREHFNKVPAPFDPAAQIDWTGVWSLTASCFRLMPTCYLYYGHQDTVGAQYCWADSNGCAAGTSLADATVRGLYELIERDSVAIWWYNRLLRPRVDLESFQVAYFDSFADGYRSVGRDVQVLDITSDLGVPSFAAVSRDIAHESEDILLTFGAHLDSERAVAHALMEMNHLLPAVLPANREAFGDYPYPDPAQKRWWSQARIADHPYIAPNPDAAALTRDSFPTCRPLDSMDELAHLRLILEGRGLEVLMLDQSRPDIDVPVAKTIVPGLRHFWKRLAPGRLYDVPVSMGWLDVARDEGALNPIAMFV